MSRARWQSSLLGLLALVAIPPPRAVASLSVTTAPVGFASLAAPASSDALISPCFVRPPAYSGVVGSLSGTVITAAANPGWVTNAWVQSLPGQPETYFVQFKSGSAAARCYTVTANTAQTITVDWNGETPAAAANDKFDLVPYWTLGTLFPASDAGVAFIASTSDTAHGTEILVPSPTTVTGINRSTSATYYFLSGSWRKVGASSSSTFDTTILPPTGYVIQRNNGAATTVSVYGRVPTGVVSASVTAQAGATRQDNAVALAFPTAVTLDGSNLQGSGAFRASTSPFFHTDELYVFDNTASGINKAAAAVYFYYNAGWRKVGAPITTSFGATAAFTPGTGVIVRKAGAGSAATTVYWTYTSPISP